MSQKRGIVEYRGKERDDRESEREIHKTHDTYTEGESGHLTGSVRV